MYLSMDIYYATIHTNIIVFVLFRLVKSPTFANPGPRPGRARPAHQPAWLGGGAGRRTAPPGRAAELAKTELPTQKNN